MKKKTKLKKFFAKFFLLMCLLYFITYKAHAQEINPVDIFLLVDISGSIPNSDDSFKNTMEAIKNILCVLKTKRTPVHDRLALMVFASSSKQIRPLSFISDSEEKRNQFSDLEELINKKNENLPDETRYCQAFRSLKESIMTGYSKPNFGDIKNRKRAIILISDGIPDPEEEKRGLGHCIEDNTIFTKDKMEIRIPVYFLNLRYEIQSVDWNSILSNKTGGRMFFASNKEGIKTNLDVIFSELGRSNPVVFYCSQNPKFSKGRNKKGEFININIEYEVLSFSPDYVKLWYDICIRNEKEDVIEAYARLESYNQVLSLPSNWENEGYIKDSLDFCVFDEIPYNDSYKCDFSLYTENKSFLLNYNIALPPRQKITFSAPENPIIIYNNSENEIEFIFSPVRLESSENIKIYGQFKNNYPPVVFPKVQEEGKFLLEIKTNGRQRKIIKVKPNEIKKIRCQAEVSFESKDIIIVEEQSEEKIHKIEFRILWKYFKKFCFVLFAFGILYIFIVWIYSFWHKKPILFIKSLFPLIWKFIKSENLKINATFFKDEKNIFRGSKSIKKGILYLSNEHGKRNLIKIPSEILEQSSCRTTLKLNFRELDRNKKVSVENLSSKDNYEKIEAKSGEEIKPDRNPTWINLGRKRSLKLTIGSGVGLFSLKKKKKSGDTESSDLNYKRMRTFKILHVICFFWLACIFYFWIYHLIDMPWRQFNPILIINTIYFFVVQLIEPTTSANVKKIVVKGKISTIFFILAIINVLLFIWLFPPFPSNLNSNIFWFFCVGACFVLFSSIYAFVGISKINKNTNNFKECARINNISIIFESIGIISLSFIYFFLPI